MRTSLKKNMQKYYDNNILGFIMLLKDKTKQ